MESSRIFEGTVKFHISSPWSKNSLCHRLCIAYAHKNLTWQCISMANWTYMRLQAGQLPAGRGCAGPGPGGQPGSGVFRPRDLLQDGHLVLVDNAGEERAVVPRRRRGELDALPRRPRRGAGPGVRRDHQHLQRRDRVRPRAQRRQHRPHWLLPALLRHVRRRLRRQPRLLLPAAFLIMCVRVSSLRTSRIWIL